MLRKTAAITTECQAHFVLLETAYTNRRNRSALGWPPQLIVNAKTGLLP